MAIFGRKRCICLYLHLKKLAPGGIWTHTVRAGEGATTLRVSAHSKNSYGLYLVGKRCIFLYLRLKKLAPGGIWTHHEVTTICHTNTICHTKRHMVNIWPEKRCIFLYFIWKSWHLVGFEPTLFGRPKVQPHYAHQLIAKTHMVFDRKKVYFIIPTPEKFGTWWDLNPPWAYNHMPYKYHIPCKKAYGLYLAGKGEFSYTYTWKCWHLVSFEPTLFGRAKVQPHYAYQPTCHVPQVRWRHC